MKYFPVTKDLEKIIKNLDAVATTKLFRALMSTTSNTEDKSLLSQASSLVTVISISPLINGVSHEQ